MARVRVQCVTLDDDAALAQSRSPHGRRRSIWTIALILSVIVFVGSTALRVLFQRQPAGFLVTQSVVIQQPAAQVFEVLRTIDASSHWLPWDHASQPAVEKPHNSLPVYAWGQADGESRGSITLVLDEFRPPAGVVILMQDFRRDGVFWNATRVTVTPHTQSSASMVTVEMAGQRDKLTRILANFQDQAREPADRLQKSLENLKRQIESGQLKHAGSES